MMYGFVLVLMMAALCAWLVMPLLGASNKDVLGLDARDAEMRELRLALIQIEDDRSSGRITPEEYAAQKERAASRLAAITATSPGSSAQ